MHSYKNLLRDPLFSSSLLLRLILWAVAISTGHYYAGDTSHYIHFADQVCDGAWGGNDNRSTFYLWFLCGTSFGGIALALLIQNLVTWWIGVRIYCETNSKLIAFFALFDPVLLIYSNIVMSDIWFAFAIMIVTIILKEIFIDKKTSTSMFVKLGGSIAFLVLARPNGIPIMYFTYALLIALCLKKLFSVKKVAIAILATLLFLSPKIFWNYQQTGVVAVNNQSSGWLFAVVGIVEYESQGLSQLDAELEWNKKHNRLTPEMFKESITTKTVSWIKLVTKSAARVLVGHVNVEWGSLFLGEAVKGPAWFRNQESRDGKTVSGIGVVIWGLGLLVTVFWCLIVYWKTLKTWFQNYRSYNKNQLLFSFWAITSTLLFVFMPIVVGDARFRLSFWTLILLFWGYSKVQNRNKEI